MNQIITVGREFGSGGRELGRRLSEELGFAYYDQEIITEIVKRTSLSAEYVHQILERKPLFSFPIHVGRTFYPTVSTFPDPSQTIFKEQHKIIREMAESSDCVIVGRCADYILKDHNPFRIFVYAEMESKIARCRAKGIEKGHTEEDLSDKELKKHILDVDKNRSKYYEFYTGHDWGKPLNYDLCINTTNMDLKEAAKHVANLIR